MLCQNFSSVFFFLLSGPGRCSCCFKRLFRSMETVCKVMRLLPYFVDNHRKPCVVSSMQLIHPYQQNLGTWYSFLSTWLGCFMAVYFILLRWCYTRRFATTILAQHSVAMLEQRCCHSKQCRNNVANLCCAKNRRCEASRVTSPLIMPITRSYPFKPQ